MPTRREELLEQYRSHAAVCLSDAGASLVSRQLETGPARGSVAMWKGEETPDFHGTLAAIWLWSRTQLIAGEARFGMNIGRAWHFIDQVWDRFIPEALSASSSDEAPFDCAMVLRAGLATHAVTRSGDWRRHADRAARLLSAYLGDVSGSRARGFGDPGFLVWNLADYARAVADRGVLSAVVRFVDRTWSTKQPPRFDDEVCSPGDLFDFSSTSATSMLALMSAEGETPFIGSWLRERVAPQFPPGFSLRSRDQNAWNACVAAAAGRAFVLSHDERFFDAHREILERLVGEAQNHDGGIPREPGMPVDTLGTFYYGLALDALVVGR